MSSKKHRAGEPYAFKAKRKFVVGAAKDPTMKQNFKFTTEFVGNPQTFPSTINVSTVTPTWFVANSMVGTVYTSLFSTPLAAGYLAPRGRQSQMLNRFNQYYVLASKTSVTLVISDNNQELGEMKLTVNPLTAQQAKNVSLITPQPLTNASGFSGLTPEAEYAQAAAMPRFKEKRMSGQTFVKKATLTIKENMSTMNSLPHWQANTANWETNTVGVALANQCYYLFGIYHLNPTITQIVATYHLRVKQTWWVEAFDPVAGALITLKDKEMEEYLLARALKAESKEEKVIRRQIDDDAMLFEDELEALHIQEAAPAATGAAAGYSAPPPLAPVRSCPSQAPQGLPGGTVSSSSVSRIPTERRRVVSSSRASPLPRDLRS